MIVEDIPEDKIHVGMIIKSIISNKWSMVILIDKKDDNYAWVLREDQDMTYSGFYGNNSKCEVVYCKDIVDNRNGKIFIAKDKEYLEQFLIKNNQKLE